MRRRSRAGGKSPNAQAPNAAARKSRIAPKAGHPRSTSTANLETEVARLARERDEALEQQAATSEVLNAISRSTFDLPTVLSTLVETAARLCRADKVQILLPSENTNRVYSAASFGYSAEYNEYLKTTTFAPGREGVVGRVLLERKPVQIADVLADPEYRLREIQRLGGFRTHLGLPLFRQDSVIGVLLVSRSIVEPFDDKHIELLSTFAAQAVIAIENARLLNELRESLQQQTATADGLKVISRSTFDLQTVLDTLVDSAARLCDADSAGVHRPQGDSYPLIASFGFSPELEEFLRTHPVVPRHETVLGRAVMERRTIHVHDIQNNSQYEFAAQAAKVGGFRTMLGVPLLREGIPIGVIMLTRKLAQPFTEKQIELVTTFADQAVIAIENVRLFEAEQQRTRELTESLEQQTATSEVLQVISSSPSDLQPVFETMLQNAVRTCGAKFGNIYRWDGELLHLLAAYNTPPALAEFRRRSAMRPNSILRRMVETKTTMHGVDLRVDEAYTGGDPGAVSAAELGGVRTYLVVPMVRENELIGSFSLFRQEVQPFTNKQIEFVTNFAAQAVIAIENTRLLNELRQRTDDLSQRTTDLTEALEQQTATSEVLRVISSSPGDLKPVFDAMLANAARLCEAKFGALGLREGDTYRIVAIHNAPQAFAEFMQREPLRPDTNGTLGRAIATKRIAQTADITIERPYLQGDPLAVAAVELGGYRTVLAVPMLKEREIIGLMVFVRQEVRPFNDKQIGLLENFASQAVIAIENTRLLNELRQRTDDLTESLEQQTATSEVLRVISSSRGELQPVFAAMLANAARICEAKYGLLVQVEADGFRPVAHHGLGALETGYPVDRVLRPEPDLPLARLARSKQVVHVLDARTEPAYIRGYPLPLIDIGGARTLLLVPMLKEDVLVGAIAIYRQEVRSFTDKQIELVKNFAAQAVIAIENARLLNELRVSLQQQTATADVLKIISGSTFDLPTVLNTLTESSARLCVADKGVILLRDGDVYRLAANYGFSSEAEQYAAEHPVQPDRGSATGRAALEGRAIHIHDVLADPEYRATNYQEAFGYRTALGVPLQREGATIGIFFLSRDEVNPFTEKQIELVTTFADQAVIAIENARLFEAEQQRTRELTESLEQQTATADVLKIISRSTFDLRTVLQTLVESAARFCNADKAIIVREKDGVFYTAEAYGYSREFLDYMKNIPIKAERGSASGRALVEGRVVHITDAAGDPEYTLVEARRLGDYRTILCVPMLREGVPIGLLVLTRSEVQPFTDEQIELVTTFADQAAIAIENVRLFEAEQQRTRELAKSLEDLRTTQDRLVQTQKLASLGQLTAGIAHEIKNPLNFVNNFSGVSTELIDELREALGRMTGDDKTRREIAELTDTLSDNLDKIVQHGKRADAIVKNMLLHSREGSGEHRPVDINALVEESLNLAYHGARAEKQGFKINLERSFDPIAGQIDVFPQEITRALLNLISNGFYAATKRKEQDNSDGYEPTLVASTKNLGDRVEIRIRDNGTGIPPEVRDKMFNPFFTTKPAGEGTGLGLSITHDIIVKQHSGSIEVDSQPGDFTEVRIILPRTATFITDIRGRT